MNFDDDDDSDFSFTPQPSNNKLAALFKSGAEDGSEESLKYKASKQPPPAAQSQTTSQQATTSVVFFSGVQAFKFLNNKYESQGKLGLAILSSPMNNQISYRILLYVTKTQPVATIRIGLEFKISLQKNNYVTFYDESRQVWSILFDTEELVANFATQITLCKCNLMQGNLQNDKLVQDLKYSDPDMSVIVEANDSIEVTTLVSSLQGAKLVEVENTLQKPFKLKLGKNKLPQIIESSIIKMKQGDRKLFVLNGGYFKSNYPNNSNSPIFYDIQILRVKKNKEESSSSNADVIDQMPTLPSLNSDNESRSRSESIKEKTKIINDQINDPKVEKAKVISRMAKLGQQMLPGSTNQSSLEQQEEWENTSTTEAIVSNELNTSLQQNLLQQQQQTQKMINDAQQAKQAMLLQNTIQQQLLAQAQAQQNQLALFKNPMNNTQLFNFIDPNGQNNLLTQQMVQQQPAQTPQDSNNNLLTKLELITEKLDQIKQITHLNNQNMPNMETQVLLQNIQRIVKENDQYKKDLYDKSAKIEEQNSKITDLLLKAQNYVEQSHQILELKNNSFQNSSEKTQNRLLELEQDKMKLTTDLTKLTSQISELNLEINRIRKDELELKQQLNDVSKNTDQYKQNSERLLVENADLQTKLDTVMIELKKERQLRKTHETKNQLNEDEINELKSNLVNSQKLLEERKRKFESERLLFEQEMDELKKSNLNEVNLLKEKLLKARSNLSESQSEQIKQVEVDLNIEWQSKLEKLNEQNEAKYERKVAEMTEENFNLKKKLNELNENIKNIRSQNTVNESESEKLKQEIDDLRVYKEKYERLQSQALVMKERYETRIKELLDAEPDTEVIAEEVKKLMNAMYKKIKSQIRPDQFYSGNGILIAMLRIIKMVTLQVLNSKNGDEQEEEDIDYFSQHIYSPQVQEPVKTESITQEVLPEKQDEVINKEVEIVVENVPENGSNDASSEDDDIQLIPEEEVKDEFKLEVEPEQENNVIENNETEENKQNSSDENIVVIPDQDEKIVEEESQKMEVENDEKIEETKQVQIETTNTETPKVSKGLFSDDDEEDDELFSSKPKSESKLFEAESESLKENNEKITNETLSNNTTAPASFKFSPPPLFDDDEGDDDNNSDKDIDWFK